MAEGTKTVEVLQSLYRELGKCPANPDLVNHLVDKIQKQFEDFKDAGESKDREILEQLIQAHAEAEERMVKCLIQLNQELCDSRQKMAAERKYLGNS